MVSECAFKKRLACTHSINVERNARKGCIGYTLFQDDRKQLAQGVDVCKDRGGRQEQNEVGEVGVGLDRYLYRAFRSQIKDR